MQISTKNGSLAPFVPNKEAYRAPHSQITVGSTYELPGYCGSLGARLNPQEGCSVRRVPGYPGTRIPFKCLNSQPQIHCIAIAAKLTKRSSVENEKQYQFVNASWNFRETVWGSGDSESSERHYPGRHRLV
eukprot:1162092-Rhodomonas_salina.1